MQIALKTQTGGGAFKGIDMGDETPEEPDISQFFEPQKRVGVLDSSFDKKNIAKLPSGFQDLTSNRTQGNSDLPDGMMKPAKKEKVIPKAGRIGAPNIRNMIRGAYTRD